MCRTVFYSVLHAIYIHLLEFIVVFLGFIEGDFIDLTLLMTISSV